MKIKTLAAMCKRAGVFKLYDRADAAGEVTEQWLGTGAAMYRLPALPYLTEDNLVAFFDITEKQRRESISFYHSQMPESLNFNDTDDEESLVEREQMILHYKNRSMQPIMTRSGLEFVDTAFLSPIADIMGELALYERCRAHDGQVYFVAKMGLLIEAVIMPLQLKEEDFVRTVEAVAKNGRAAFIAKKERDAQRDAEAGQTIIDDGEA